MVAGPAVIADSQRWGSSWTLVMVAAGAAVGFSNIWWLPVLAGQHGGAVYWLLYLACLLVLGVPVLIAEFAAGAAGRSDPVSSVERILRRSGRSPIWAHLAWLAPITGLVLAPLLLVVAAWTFSFGVMAWHGQLLNIDAQAASSIFNQVMITPDQTMFWAGAVLTLAMAISMLGVVHGLGLAARILLPMALALFVGVAYYSRHFGDLDATFAWLFHVDWEQLSWRSFMLALAQAVFSMGIGTGVMMTLGAHLPYEDDIPVAAFAIVLVEVFLAVLAGYVILPMVFASNLEPAGGAAMLFIGVPVAFGGLVNGQLFTVALYFAVLIAALTSIIALMEPAVSVLCQRRRMPRFLSVLIVGFFLWLLVLACLFSLAGWEHANWFYGLDALSRWLLPALATGAAILMGWMATPMLSEQDFDQLPYWLYRAWRFTVRWLALPGMALVWLSYLTGLS